MYKQHYGLKLAPFELTPDPKFFFATPQHNEAMATLWCGVQQRKGFVVVTGQVGAGKTLLVRYLLQSLARTGVQFCHIFNPRLSATDFLQYVMADFDLPAFGKSKAELLFSFNRWLITKHRSGSIAALIIDEAHLLDWDVLEEVRLLTNLETNEHKLLQVVLIGQTELDDKIDSPQLTQLKQRIAFRTKLTALTEADTAAYIQQRLAKAGSSKEFSIFPYTTCSYVYQYSGGIPRLINSICQNALITGFAKQARTVDPEVILEVAHDLGLKQPSAEKTLTSPVGDCRIPSAHFDRVQPRKII